VVHTVEFPAGAGFFGCGSLSIVQAVEALGVSRRTIYYWIKAGRLQTFRTSMGSQRVLVGSVVTCWRVRP
jgi:excisionase family DNA binding protein